MTSRLEKKAGDRNATRLDDGRAAAGGKDV